MKKIYQIGIKDLQIMFRDRAALILMLVAPFVLTLGLGLVTGSFSQSSNSANIDPIPVVIIDEDKGQLSQGLVDLFSSEELADLVSPVPADSAEIARQKIADDEITAVVIIPAGFSDSIIPERDSGNIGSLVNIEIVANPSRPIGSSIVEAIVTEFLSRVNGGKIAVTVSIEQLLQSGFITTDQIADVAEEMGTDLVNNNEDQVQPITLETQANNSNSESTNNTNALTILAPGMAVFFLIYTVMLSGRTFLEEWERGTLPRILTTPTSMAQVIGGKMVGTFFTGIAQVSILIVASTLLFRLNWGDPVGLILLVVSVVAAATGWGMMITAVAQTPTQVSSIGGAAMLLFGILGGNFVSISYTGIMNVISHLTPNAWATDGFTRLAHGGSAGDIMPVLGALLAMAAVLFAITTTLFRRRWG